jgi:hypothetical protein
MEDDKKVISTPYTIIQVQAVEDRDYERRMLSCN